MSGRMTLGSLFVLAALIPGLCWAQGGYGYGQGGPPGAWQGQAPSPVPPQYAANCPPPQGPSNTIYEQLPDDLGFLHDDSPLEVALKNLFRHSYYRGEYLLWSASRPGNVLLGQEPASGFVPSTYALPVPDNTFATTALSGNPASAILPSLSDFAINNLSGYKGTVGLNIGRGNFELSAFVLQTRKNTFDGTSMITQEIPVDLLATPPITTAIPGNFIGQPISVNGGQTVMLYESGYVAVMKTNIWGSEANYILDAPNAGTGDWLTFSPMLGFRYLNYLESLGQAGGYQFLPDPTTPTATANATRAMYSQSNNNVYGPQIGLRGELSVARVTVGVEPKVMLGLNSYAASLSTLNIPNNDPTTNSNFNFHRNSTTFSPLADFRVYSRIAISKYAHVFFAYNIMWVGSLTRPYDSMGYNILSNGTGLFDPKLTDSVIQGLSVGGELKF